MPTARGNFHAGNDVERVMVTLLICPKAGIQHVMIGNGDDIQITSAGNTFQDLSSGCKPIAGTGVHVNISATSELRHFHETFLFFKARK